MGAAYRSPKPKQVAAIAQMIREVRALGMETCATLGMLTPAQAVELKEAGLDYYNHNIDTSPAVLRQGHHDAHVPGSPGHARSRAQRGPEGLLRRHPRDGRDDARSRGDAHHARQSAHAPGKRADQSARADPGHAPAWQGRRGSFRLRARDRRRATHDAGGARAPVRRSRSDER